MTQNPNKTTDLVVSRSRTVNIPNSGSVMSGVSICASPNLDILGVKFRQLALLRRPCAWYCFSYLSKNWYVEVDEVCHCGHLCIASLLLCIRSPNPSLSIILRCGALLRNVIFSFSSARCIRGPGFGLIRLYCRCVIDAMLYFVASTYVSVIDCVCCIRLIRTRIIVCSVSFNLLLSEFDIPDLRLQPIH